RFVAAAVERQHLTDELVRLAPAECLVAEGNATLAVSAGSHTLVTERAPWSFSAAHCRRVLLDHFGTTTLDGFGWTDDSSPGITRGGALREYGQEPKKSTLHHMAGLEPFVRGSNLLIDEATRRSLELTRTLRDDRREGSLLAVIDETVTPMGARLLAEWLSNPLTNLKAINQRLDAVQELSENHLLSQELRESLKTAYDLQRLTARVATGRASPRDLRFLTSTLELLPKIKAKLCGRHSALLNELESQLDLCADVRSAVESALVDDPPLSILEGGVIRPGFNAAL